MSRADLARALGLTRSTAGNLVSGLISEGMVVEGEKTETARRARTGRPGDAVRLNPDYAIFLGADIGVSQLTVVALDLNANLLLRKTQTLQAGHIEPKQMARKLAKLVGKVTCKLQAEQIVRGLTVTIPGLPNHDGEVLRAPILGWRNVPLMAMLKAQFPEFEALHVENDANAAAFAELYRAKERNPGEAIYLFLDAGVGGGVFTRGALVTGCNGYAGEVGHLLVGETGYGPLLTLKGSLESFIGREAILSRYKHHRGARRSLDALIAATGDGERAAVATFEDCAHYLARGLATLISVLNPGEFVLGGPVAAFFAQNPERIRAKIRENLLPNHPLPGLRFSPLGSDGPAIGAACLMHRAFLASDKLFEGWTGEP